MIENFDACLAHLLKHEGGYVNHPSDPGGRTNLGVTQKVWEDWVGRPSSEIEMKALTPDKVNPLYKDMYWDQIKGDRLPSGVDYCVLDAAVNSGVYRAGKWLQQTVGAKVDGGIGEQTLNLVRLTDSQNIINKFCSFRLEFLKALSTWPTFGKGWERRVHEVQISSIEMSRAK
jgi:lysozyme family protein